MQPESIKKKNLKDRENNDSKQKKNNIHLHVLCNKQSNTNIDIKKE